MPPWAEGVRVEDITPAFDVFSLGKLLWSMVNPKKILRREYFNEPEYDLQELYRDSPYIYMANKLFSKCIVEREKDCLPSAQPLLEVLDEYLEIIGRRGDLVEDGVDRPCKVCGQGYYKQWKEPNQNPYMDIAKGSEIYICMQCGNIQLFKPNILASPRQFGIID